MQGLKRASRPGTGRRERIVCQSLVLMCGVGASADPRCHVQVTV